MAFALLYNDTDLGEMERAFTEARVSNAMTGQQRNRAGAYWNAGLSGWRTAALTHEPQYNCEPEGCRVVVVSLSGGSRADFLNLCDGIVARLSVAIVEYFAGIVADMHVAGCVEPWPQA